MSGHTFPRTNDATASTADETASISSSDSSAISSLGSTSSPGCSLSAIFPNTTKPPPLQPVDEKHVDDDPDGLEFVGAFLADISTDDDVWVSVTPYPPSFTTQVGVTADIANGTPPSDWNSDSDSWSSVATRGGWRSSAPRMSAVGMIGCDKLEDCFPHHTLTYQRSSLKEWISFPEYLA